MGWRTSVSCLLPGRRWQMDRFRSLVLRAALTLAHSLKHIPPHTKLQKLVGEEGWREGIRGMKEKVR